MLRSSYTAAADRMSGYREVLATHGILYDESLVRYGDFDPDSGYQQMKDLLRINKTTNSCFCSQRCGRHRRQGSHRGKRAQNPWRISHWLALMMSPWLVI